MISEVRKELWNHQDLSYQKFQQNLCPGVNNIIGVRTPIIRKITKHLLKQNYTDYLQKEKKYYEEIMIEGLLIATSKMDIEDKFTFLDSFIPKINCWAITDICASSFQLKKDKKKMWNYLEKYQKSTEEYPLRFMIVMWMDHYLTEDYLDEVFTKIDHINSEHYYVKMAIAWLISIAYIKDKEKTIAYLKQNSLSTWTYNKALQKIIESTRVSKEEKLEIKKMKKK